MGWGDQGRQHQTRVSPSQSMTIPGLLHVRCGSFGSKAAEAVRPCISATPPKADVNSPPWLPALSAITGREQMQQTNVRQCGYSITSSAVAIRVGGTARPSILAVQALMTNSNLVDCTTGKSAGFAPLRMRPA